jgi:aldehyde:ferredoxin oxidoreductase
MKGNWNRVIRVNLSKREIKEEDLPEGAIGGKDLASRVLLSSSLAEPLSEESLFIIATGPFSGTGFPGSSRFGAFFRSPLTGIFGESYCGGFFAYEMKKTGYDALIVSGKAEKPVYLWIHEGGVEIRDASHLWGKDAWETEDEIKKEHGKCEVLSIGIAGENLVKFANVAHRKGRQLGRTGAGAVMGSKNLKAIVVRGEREIEVADEERLEELKNEISEKGREVLKAISEFGTPNILAVSNNIGALPTNYWIDGSIEHLEALSAETLKKKYFKRKTTCYACPIACGKYSVIEEGKFRGTEVEGPEYETLYALGSLCGIEDVEAVIKGNELCDRFGMDTMTAGNVVAMVMYLMERGVLTEKEVGFSTSFGDSEGMLRLLEMIAKREGFGGVLAEGCYKAAERIGEEAKRAVIHVKGLEPAAYDPRALKGMALAYAVSPRGACHLRHMIYRPNLTGKHPFDPERSVDRLSYNQAEVVKELEDFYAITSSLLMCNFWCLPTIGPVLWSELKEIYESVAGDGLSMEDFKKIGVEINNRVRKFNIKCGVSRKDDRLPERFFSEPLRKGASSGEIVEKERFEEMLSEYYALRDWDEEGIPKEG